MSIFISRIVSADPEPAAADSDVAILAGREAVAHTSPPSSSLGHSVTQCRPANTRAATHATQDPRELASTPFLDSQPAQVQITHSYCPGPRTSLYQNQTSNTLSCYTC
eukprot:2221011-Rhodomonas_salina.1